MGTGFCGGSNSAVGARALSSNTTGWENTAVGQAALNGDTAVGSGALSSNSIGFDNTGVGDRALQTNSTGVNNTAVGASALANNTTANGNTAVGDAVLDRNTTGNGNTGMGHKTRSSIAPPASRTPGLAISRSSRTPPVWRIPQWVPARWKSTPPANPTRRWATRRCSGNTTGSNNVGLGKRAGYNLTTGGNNIDIGNLGVAAEANTIRIGDPVVQTATFIAGIRGATTGMADGVTVLIDSNGQLGTISSSRRFKTDIHDMGAVSSKLMRAAAGDLPIQAGGRSERHHAVRIDRGGGGRRVPRSRRPRQEGHDRDGEVPPLASLLLNEVQKQHQQMEQVRVENASLRAQVEEIGELKARLTALEAASPDGGRTLREAALHSH